MLDFGFYNMDCMKGMAEFPDNYFDLAIVDPPYGGAADGSITRTGGTWPAKYQKENGMPDIRKWDLAPTKEYFGELFRVSRNQIIWGGNYFELPPTRCFIIWEKGIAEKFSMSMCEYAWTSFDANAKLFKFRTQGTKNEPRMHPTQKPVALYKWLLENYAKAGDKVLDTHVGSASSLIACHYAHCPYVGFEIDETYYQQAVERLARQTAQIALF